jgi:signal transduction histidine kinase
MTDMRLYASLSRFRFLDRNYSFKFLFIAFLGVHIPLIGIILFVVLSGFNSMSPLVVIQTTLVFTLIACGITLLLQNALAKPIVVTKNALDEYLTTQKLPDLPTGYKDEVGVLMNNTSKALQQLDSLLKDKRDFIYLLTHDLKTPLHNVLTLLHLMQDDAQNHHKDEHLHLIRQSTRNQLQLIETVLNLASSEYADLAKNKPVSLEPMLNRVIQNLNISLQNKQLEVLLDVPYTMQVTVNEELFSMALTNLLTNAIKFSNRNSEIMVRAIKMDGYIMLRVIDYGLGFTVSKAPNFAPFSKTSRPGTDGEATNGLGLYFTHKIIAYHGGTLTAESEGEGKGAKFIIKMPVAD